MRAILALIVAIACVQAIPSILSICEGGLGAGYDFVEERAQLPVVQLTYTMNQTVNLDGNTYLIPDQLFYTANSGGESRNDIQIINSVSQYFSSYWKSTSLYVSANIDGVNAKFGFAHTAAGTKSMFGNNTNNFALNDNIQKKFSLELFPGFDLHPQFLRMIKTLPQQYDPVAYGKLIRYWGTHFVTFGQFGSKWNITSVWNTSIYNTKSTDWIKNQVSLSIGYQAFSFGINSSTNQNHTTVDNFFESNSYTTTVVLGGDINTFNTKGYAGWMPTLETNWGLVMPKSELSPIYELIDDSVIAANVKRAVLFYGNNGYIEGASARVWDI